jgi:hypothetical protein
MLKTTYGFVGGKCFLREKGESYDKTGRLYSWTRALKITSGKGVADLDKGFFEWFLKMLEDPEFRAFIEGME